MRNLYARAPLAGLLVLLASPAFAQPPGGRFGGMMQEPSAAMLLRDDKVQTELMLTDDQKAQFKKIADKFRDDIQKARDDKDFKKMFELFQTASAEVDKQLPDILKPDQVKRLKQLELQAAGCAAFTKDDVQTALKLTDAQKKEITATQDDIKKDAADLLKDAQGDMDKMREAFKKIQGMRKDALAKVMDSLTDDQKKAWKDLAGDKFEFSPPGSRRPGGDDKPKDPPKDK